MTNNLENQYLQFKLDLQEASWSIHPREKSGLHLEDIRMAAAYRCSRTRFQVLKRWDVEGIADPPPQHSALGLMRQVRLSIASDENGVSCRLDFAILEENPIFLWRVTIHNQGSQAISLDRITLLDAAMSPPEMPEPGYAFFSNGWGSWNFTGAYGAHDHFRRTRLGPLISPMRVNAGTPHPKQRGRFGSDMFGVLGNRATRGAVLAGFLSQRTHFGSLEASLHGLEPNLRLWANGDGARLDPGERITTDWVCLTFVNVDDPDPLGPYLDAVAQEGGINAQPSKITSQHSEIPVGWCSWYHFYQNVSAEDIRRNLEILAGLRAQLPLETVQIDDGFETLVGDWFSFRPTFPEGVSPLAEEIDKAGFTPGLWLAPFIAQRGSDLVKEHPDWLLRGQFNRPVNAGFIWNDFTTALDLTNPEALIYAQEVVHTAAHDWGFPYLKLDFLYAAALPGRYRDATKTRAQVMRAGLEALRQAAGEGAYILGCGCPLGSAIGLVDSMRIGADVGERWRPAYFGAESYFSAEPDMPSARNAIQNAITRAPMHRRWWANDPDCLLLRESTKLTLAEVQSLASVIALSDGAFLLSDDLTDVPPERLRIAQVMLPLIGKRPWALDWFDALTPSRLRVDLDNETGHWHLLALFNWDDEPSNAILRLADYRLEPERTYWAREFWRAEGYLIRNGALEIQGLPAHGVALFAIREILPGQPLYLGSDLHISQGQEVNGWIWDSTHRTLTLSLERPGNADGVIEISLPSQARRAHLNNDAITWEQPSDERYKFNVEFNRSAKLRIECE